MRSATAEQVFVGLGANLGDREGQIRTALDVLARVPGVAVERVSTLRPSRAVVRAGSGSPADQPDYLNGVAQLRTTLPPTALLAVLKELEAAAGRAPGGPRDAPRPLDLDILLHGERSVDARELRVPHPCLLERSFWLEPLAELGLDRAALEAAVRPRPRVVEDAHDMSAQSASWKRGDCLVGLVPTMGALHEGHAELVRAARAECDRVVVSIFVNPLQFGPGEDLDRYPRTLEQDLALLRREDVDAVFVPRPASFQPEGFCSRIRVGPEAETMEGAERPGHFEGVATVVAQLFAVAQPDVAYFGRKDAQQVAVVERMTGDLGFPIRIRACPIVRESDGLALSSRNVYLTAGDRAAASVLSRSLFAARDAHGAGETDPGRLLEGARAILAQEPRCRLDYLELRTEPTLAPWPAGRPVDRARLLVAARFGPEGAETRLLDNVTLGAGMAVEESARRVGARTDSSGKSNEGGGES